MLYTNQQKWMDTRTSRIDWSRAGGSLLFLLIGIGAMLASPGAAWSRISNPQHSRAGRIAGLPRLASQAGEQIDALLTQLTNNRAFSGSVLVAQHGQLLLDKGYSLSDWDSGTPNQPDTHFYLGSLTKAFTAMALMILQEQGKLHAQDRLCDYIPACPAPWQVLSIQQVLTHTSGIPQLSDAQLSAASPDAWIASFSQAPLQFRPGGEFQYCSICYQILAYVVQQVSGLPYTQFIQQMILTPLQMNETGFDSQAYYSSPAHAQGYETWGVKAIAAGFQAAPQWSFLFGSGLLYSTVNDLYLWDRALSTTRLVSQATLDQIFAPWANAAPLFVGSSYGYGWVITQPPTQDHYLIWHDGIIDGFRNYIGRSVKDGLTVIILSNLTTLDAISLGHQIERMLLGSN